MTDNGKLTPAQKRAISALLTSRDVRGAAEVAGVGERTLHRWLADDPLFRATLTAAEGEAIDATTRRLVGLQDGAIDTIKALLDDKTTPATVRLRAAAAVLDYLLKLRELRNVEARLAALEAVVAVGQKKQKRSKCR